MARLADAHLHIALRGVGIEGVGGGLSNFGGAQRILAIAVVGNLHVAGIGRVQLVGIARGQIGTGLIVAPLMVFIVVERDDTRVVGIDTAVHLVVGHSDSRVAKHSGAGYIHGDDTDALAVGQRHASRCIVRLRGVRTSHIVGVRIAAVEGIEPFLTFVVFAKMGYCIVCIGRDGHHTILIYGNSGNQQGGSAYGIGHGVGQFVVRSSAVTVTACHNNRSWCNDGDGGTICMPLSLVANTIFYLRVGGRAGYLILVGALHAVDNGCGEGRIGKDVEVAVLFLNGLGLRHVVEIRCGGDAHGDQAVHTRVIE